MVLIRQNKGAKIIFHAKSPTFGAAKFKGFTVLLVAPVAHNHTVVKTRADTSRPRPGTGRRTKLQKTEK